MDGSRDQRAARVARRKASQDKNLFGRMSASSIASRSQAQRLLKAAAGLSIIEWRVLWDLAEAGPLSIQDMSSIQRTDHSLISRALPAMRDKGYVTTTPDEDDKRQSLVALTDTGRQVYDAASPTMQTRRAKLEEALGPEALDTLFMLLDRFDAYVDTPQEPPQKDTP